MGACRYGWFGNSGEVDATRLFRIIPLRRLRERARNRFPDRAHGEPKSQLVRIFVLRSARLADATTGCGEASRYQKVAAAGAGSGTESMAARTNPFAFLQQVRTEVSKVTWPSRRETMITTLMVFIMVILAAIFFFSVDQILGWGVEFLLSLAR
jgi:preprotein translocase subunit SecE